MIARKKAIISQVAPSLLVLALVSGLTVTFNLVTGTAVCPEPVGFRGPIYMAGEVSRISP
jgi:hypothetical protein